MDRKETILYDSFTSVSYGIFWVEGKQWLQVAQAQFFGPMSNVRLFQQKANADTALRMLKEKGTVKNPLSQQEVVVKDQTFKVVPCNTTISVRNPHWVDALDPVVEKAATAMLQARMAGKLTNKDAVNIVYDNLSPGEGFSIMQMLAISGFVNELHEVNDKPSALEVAQMYNLEVTL